MSLTRSESATGLSPPSGAPSLAMDRPRLLALDGLRGAAALMVVFYHTLGTPRGGHFGVDLFFVLSGFLISGQMLAEARSTGAIRLGRFYGRRLFRLLPAFLLLYGLYSLMHVLAPHDIDLVSPLRLPGLLLLTNVHIVQGTFQLHYLTHLWTLSIEWQFYLVWPILLAALIGLGVSERTIGWLAVVLTFLIWIGRLNGYGNFRFDGLTLGSAAAVGVPAETLRRLMASRPAGWLLVAAVAAFVYLVAKVPVDVPWLARYGLEGVTLLATFIVLALALSRSRLLDRIFTNRVMVHVGRISYGLYLYHGPIAALMFVHLLSGPQKLIGGLFVAVPLADCSWRYVERPLIGVGRRLFPSRRGEAAAAVSRPAASW